MPETIFCVLFPGIFKQITFHWWIDWRTKMLYNSVLASKYFSKFFSISFGDVVGAWRSTGFPFLSMMNLVKFHLMPSNNIPPCSFFKYCHKGAAVLPFTSTFSNRSNLTLWSRAKHWISSAFPGSWLLNWSQGKARTRRPEEKQCYNHVFTTSSKENHSAVL